MNRSNRTAIVFLALSIAGLLALMAWWWLRRQVEEEIILTTEAGTISRFRIVDRSKVRAGRTAPPTDISRPAAAVDTELETPPPPDDLTVILGIGPKTARVLKTAGIASFSQLARTEVERLQSILGEAGYRLAEPDSWPEQARLAAAGDREALEKFQDELRQRRQG